ncbi:CapA family protein [Mesorhizobium sp. BAC0120]|uniref:CapA family protein n=1 Tax=Mesorhizobium sp. BAC0120 TaxID=3090670 RepID=UPI00298CD0FB|nr:CapA family protein [Mesorhizobium sp. BAC0120]MDW6022331.1 CapA family protein [Mesorhizobium sp. BAC0120]
MSNFPLTYKLSWLPRLLKPSLAGDRQGFLPPQATLLSPMPVRTRRLVFLGDISAVANREAPEIEGQLRGVISSADLVIGNCESPVVEKIRRPLGTAAGTRHAMTPLFLAETMAAAGMAPSKLLLSLANNHMLDQDQDGYAETREALASAGIATIGAAEDRLLREIELGGVTVAFAAFTEWRNTGREAFAGRVTMLADLAERDFATLRGAKADLVCVVAHWDREFRHFPQRATRKLARSLTQAGAGLIVGHHAHVLQPAHRIGQTLTAYGLGDFLGTALPRIPWPARLGAVLVVEVSLDPSTRGRVAAYRFVPFLRERLGRRERLVPLEAKTGSLSNKARRRFAAIFPGARMPD